MRYRKFWKNVNGIFKNDYPSTKLKVDKSVDFDHTHWNEIEKETGVSESMFLHSFFKLWEILKREGKDVNSTRMMIDNLLIFYLTKPGDDLKGMIGLKMSDSIVSFCQDDKLAIEVARMGENLHEDRENGADVKILRQMSKIDENQVI